jgi:3-methyladenine DNA glycosylase AlkD
MPPQSLVCFVQSRLRAAADPAKAGPMQAYMKTDMPFYGVPKPQRTIIAREIKKQFPIESARDYKTAVLALWELPHREEKYLAIGVAQMWPAFILPTALPMYRRMIVEGAWWDFVDDVAIRLVGRVMRAHRAGIKPVMEQWIDLPGEKHMWLRRSALLCQIGHKLETDEAQLFDHCLRRGHEKEFFIRKAIGWALREYAWTSTGKRSVRRFLREHGDKLAPLSMREASRHL